MKGLEITGRTVEEAIQKGLRKLALEHNEVEIKILDEGKAGLFGLMGASPAKVKISQKKTGEGISQESLTSTSVIQAKQILEKTLCLMKIESKVESFLQEQQVFLDIKTKDSSLLLEKKGQLLDSLQFLVNLSVGKSYQQKIILDIEGYRTRQKEKLVCLAQNSAEKVKTSREKIILAPLSPPERKIIHSTLQSDPFVQTVSHGEGPFRRITISLKENK
ncbi:protein jag [bacterium]|nr:protein jag [bacterium]